ncbi:LacI family DNA-binding transcriptional regulator [Puniceibacterium sp. IMCC21224]|uniref:LacI family DNA-binding transcriptional regulator n=1 Tax=Puniceibacterium sp. IMCC21224 TaxID=1618204 RepID=UPI00065CD71E|nr:LacI family DNA-binding transcriptional regulator [Puniceibacterium sp. IMCC21224]KMK65216.1 transcriptional regulator, LacI family [Puniceibacterium sp. IMCC21224]
MPRMAKERSHESSKSRVTMAAVGRMAGVSQVTVSRALSHPGKVSPDTLRRIRDAIEATGFVPNALAGALASKRSNLITALIPSLTNIVYSSFVATFSEHMRSHGYQVLLSETGFDAQAEEALIATHLSRRPDAMLLTGIHHSAQARRLLLGADIPVVEVWDVTDSPIDMCVGFNHAEAGRAVAEYLHGLGHRCAGTITASDARAVRRQVAFADRFFQLSGCRVEDSNTGGPASIGAGRKALTDLIETRGFSSGAIFCSSDLLAHGVMIEARARGLSVPGDVSVVGFGDQDFARDLDPPLSTVRIDRLRLGDVAADALLCRIAGGTPEKSVVDLGFEIIRRATI